MKTALIWGASGGIGAALTRLLVAEGWQVAGAARRVDAVRNLTPLAFSVDVRRPASVQDAVTAMSQEINEVDWWVYCAGEIASAPIQNQAPAQFQRILDANLIGAYTCMHTSLPLLSKDAPLAFIGAVHERLRLPGLSAYAASKAGLEALAEVARKELRRTVLLARPGAVDTPLWKNVPFKLPAGAASPDLFAVRLYRAYQNGIGGVVDHLE
jgi:NAD(P)-dependent dehydrogenase (short-subunit alcohol dehydrogenase family)